MLRKLQALIAFLLLLVGLQHVEAEVSSIQERRLPSMSEKPVEWLNTLTPFEGFELITAETGSLSRTTEEQIIGQSVYLSAYVEGFDGNYHRGLSDNPQQILLFTTKSGRFVIRFLDWPCAC